MTYKSRTRGNAVLLDSEVLEASQKATGIDPMIAIREKYPDAELIFSTPERFPFNPYEQLEAFRRGYHDEMSFDFSAAEERMHALLPIVVGHNNAPCFFEGELDRIRALNATGRFSPRLYPHQEEALRHVQTMPYVVMELDSCKPLDLGIGIHGQVAMDIEAHSLKNFRPLITNPRRGVSGMFDSYAEMTRSHVIIDEAHVWDRNPVRKELSWGLDIRYKFKREDGMTHAQICKEELKTIKKRRKAAMKQLDACGARYEAALKEEENVR
jgi:hypothetical protein